MFTKRAASALNHTDICLIHEVDQTLDGQRIISVPSGEGQSQRHMIDPGFLAADETADITPRIGRGLGHAHEP